MKLALALLLATPQAAPFERGKIVDGTAANKVTWHVRVPKKVDPRRPSPALLIFHGSNMNSKAYVSTIVAAWPKLAEEYILIGINGENRVKGSSDENPAYNYTYVNFAGKSKYKGYPGTDRESPALVAEVVQELKKSLKISKLFVGGHSQGGFLTYSCYMNYPDLFAGAFPISCGLIVQCEPSAYDKEDIRAQQREGALAIVHGENDGVVGFSMGRSAHESFQDDAFPALRLFTDPRAAHMFARLPVEEAVRWLESMTADDPRTLLAFAQSQFGKGEFRDALAVADRAARLDTRKRYSSKIRSLRKAVDKKAAPQVKALAKAMARAADDSWVADFMKFRAQFEFADSAKGVLQAYGTLREKHEKPARDLWYAARRDFQAKRRDEGYKKYEEIVAKYYGSSWYRYAKRSLERRN